MANWRKTTQEVLTEMGNQLSIILAGACNYPSKKERDNIRNPHRDELSDLLEEHGLDYGDVQIHEDTHGRKYDWLIDGPAEKMARNIANLRVYEIIPQAISGITFQEILVDATDPDKKTIVWFHGPKIFEPEGLGTVQVLREKIKTRKRDILSYLHHIAYANLGKQLRNELVPFLDQQEGNLRKLFSDPNYSWRNHIIIVEGDTDVVFAEILKQLGLD